MPYRILWTIASILLSLSVVSAQNGPRLVVAWVEMGDLWVWQEDDTRPSKLVTGDVITPYIAPDGGHVAFTRGVNGIAESLWLVANNTTEAVNLTLNLMPLQGVQPVLSQIGWQDEQFLYFNTALPDQLGLTRQDDLWHVNIVTRKLSQIFPPGQGGDFTFSPDHKHLALVYPGEYGTEDGLISLVTLSNFHRSRALNFPAVSTASNYKFYPQISWDNSVYERGEIRWRGTSFFVALPDKDLIYNVAGIPLVQLWNIPLDLLATYMGPPIRASLFGLPGWSASGQYLAYVRQAAAVADNQLELVVTSTVSRGTDAVVYASGTTGTLGVPHWLPVSEQFIYPQGEPGDYWLGAPDQPSQRLPEKMYYPHFVDSATYVYATYPGDPYELRYARMGDSNSTVIAIVANPAPVLDALLVP
jgi:hypothetical protein